MYDEMVIIFLPALYVVFSPVGINYNGCFKMKWDDKMVIIRWQYFKEAKL